jgi:bifunctional non-homologous end joining protein LigD
MLATTGIPPSIDRWAAEPKLDGWRARVLVDGDDLLVRTRAGRIITGSVPAVEGLTGLRAVLDGELVADAGRLDDFYRLGAALAHRERSRVTEVTFVAFDLLWADDELLCSLPYDERRKRLEALDLPARGVPVMPQVGWEKVPALFKACTEQGVEGIVLKELDGRYHPGRRSASWRKLKCSAWLEHRSRRATR